MFILIVKRNQKKNLKIVASGERRYYNADLLLRYDKEKRLWTEIQCAQSSC